MIAWLAPAWALVAAATGGVGWMIGPLRVSSRQPWRPAIAGIMAALYCAWRFPRAEIEADGVWLERGLRRMSPPVVVVPLLIATALGIGIWFGTFAVGGSDSYGYVSQARLWMHGTLRIAQPWVQQMSWPQREWTFAPLGYRPLSNDGTIVPTYAPGLPMLMAAFERIFGDTGPFLPVPVLGALAIWFTYLLGREATASKSVGLVAGALLLTSPIFLAYTMQPMTDAPMAALWTLVCLLAIREPRPRALAAGFAAGSALLIRPNLLLLVLMPLAAWLWPSVRRKTSWAVFLRHALLFCAGLAPGVLAIAIINTYLYGSPLVSGYGNLGDLYGLRPAATNLVHYGSWLTYSETPLVALAIVPLAIRKPLRAGEQYSSARAALGGMLIFTLLSYLFYFPFDAWFYLRFLLPAFPALFILIALAIRLICLRLPSSLRAPAACLLCLVFAAHGLRVGREWGIFNQRSYERRYEQVAHDVARLTTPNAVLISVQHSGSVRYYAGRLTLRWDWLPEDKLDAAIEELRMKGYYPYILLDETEEQQFRERFGPSNAAGTLNWKPMAMIAGQTNIYDPAMSIETSH